MKKSVLTLSFAFFALFTMQSCSKQTNVEPVKATANTIMVTSDSYSLPQNGYNPIDSVGYYHNQLLNYFASQGANGSTDVQTLINMSGDYFSNIYGEELGNSIVARMKKDEDIAQVENNPLIKYEDLYDSLDVWRSNGKISAAIMPYYTNVLNSLDDIDTTGTEEGYVSAINEIISIESNVMGNESINAVQKMRFFAFSSVARYSTYFWFEIKTGGIIFSPETYDIGWKTVVGIVVSDLEGAAAHVEDPVTEILAGTGQEVEAIAYLAGWAAVHSFFSWLTTQH